MSIWILVIWEEYKYLKLKWGEPIAEYFPKAMRLLAHMNSGAGDQYIFQGFVDLGTGEHQYNLTIYVNEGKPPCWEVEEIKECVLCRVTVSIRDKGILFAQALANSLPTDISVVGAKHTVDTIREIWSHAASLVNT